MLCALAKKITTNDSLRLLLTDQYQACGTACLLYNNIIIQAKLDLVSGIVRFNLDVTG